MKKLMPLADWNKQREDLYSMLNTYPKPNGVECPKCKGELNDISNCILTYNPPKKNVTCPSCGYTGYRTA